LVDSYTEERNRPAGVGRRKREKGRREVLLVNREGREEAAASIFFSPTSRSEGRVTKERE